MTVKQQINRGTIQRLCHCVIVFLFIRVTLCQFYSFTFPALFIKNNKHEMREKTSFCINVNGYFSVSRYITGGRKSYL